MFYTLPVLIVTKNQPKPSRSFTGIASIIAAATLISKFFGLIRQQVISAVFGQGEPAAAFYYAYMIPGFLLILLGGVNGSFYTAVVSVLAKHNEEEAPSLIETITTLVGLTLLVVSILIFIFAPNLIDTVAAGLRSSGKELVREIAIQQLRIMSPMAVLAGLIGISFGVLNSAKQYWLPAVSPLFSSTAVIVSLIIFRLQMSDNIAISSREYAITGGALLAGGCVVGAFLQCLVQIVAQAKSGMGRFRLRFDFQQPAIKQILKIMLPAVFSSGMLQINLATDLFFASSLPDKGVSAALANAGLLVQTPLGVFSNMILVPLLPILAGLATPENWHFLKIRIRQGLILSALVMLPLGALIISLALPIVRIAYERGNFNTTDSVLVSTLLVANGFGMFVYLGRDILIRVFYALGNGVIPFRISVFNIFLNALLDWLLVKVFNIGAPGLVYATVGVNISSMLMLLFLLNHKLSSLPLKKWFWLILGLVAASLVAGLASMATLQATQRFLGTEGLIIQMLQVSMASAIGLSVFSVFVAFMKLPEADLLVTRLRKKLLRK